MDGDRQSQTDQSDFKLHLDRCIVATSATTTASAPLQLADRSPLHTAVIADAGHAPRLIRPLALDHQSTIDRCGGQRSAVRQLSRHAVDQRVPLTSELFALPTTATRALELVAPGHGVNHRRQRRCNSNEYRCQRTSSRKQQKELIGRSRDTAGSAYAQHSTPSVNDQTW